MGLHNPPAQLVQVLVITHCPPQCVPVFRFFPPSTPLGWPLCSFIHSVASLHGWARYANLRYLMCTLCSLVQVDHPSPELPTTRTCSDFEPLFPLGHPSTNYRSQFLGGTIYHHLQQDPHLITYLEESAAFRVKTY